MIGSDGEKAKERRRHTQRKGTKRTTESQLQWGTEYRVPRERERKKEKKKRKERNGKTVRYNY